VASVSKTVTTTAILLAVQDGLLDLDAPITTYLPWFTVRSRLEPHPERRITVRHLLSHTAGFTSDAPLGNNYDHNRSSFEDHVRSICSTWLRFRVGERFSYSNMGVDLAGYILQVASGRPFPEYVHEKLFAPLGMTVSSYDLEDISRRPDRAVGHTQALEAVPLDIPLIPAGALHTSVSDLARFVRFHLNGGTVDGRRLLDARLLESMYTIPFPVAGQDEGYALAIDRRHSGGTEQLSHSGRGYGFESYVLWYPGEGIGAAVLANASSGWVHVVLARELLERVRQTQGNAQAPAPGPPASEPIVVPATSALRPLQGSYVNERGGTKKVVLVRERLGFEGAEGFSPFTFHGERELSVQARGETVRYRFVDQPGGAPSLVRVRDGTWFDYNEGPLDAPGPARSSWRELLGTYRIRMLGRDVQSKHVRLVKGHLFIDELRALEYQPGLFFESTGEALDFRTDPPTWGNIRLVKQPAFALPRSRLERLAGNYEVAPGRCIRVTLDRGGLLAEARGAAPWSLHTYAPGREPRDAARIRSVHSFFAALGENDFGRARKDFDESLKEQASLSESALRETWREAEKRRGAFRAADVYDLDDTRAWGAATFGPSLVDFVFRFDLEGRISGVEPAAKEEEGKLPLRVRLVGRTPDEFVVDGFDYTDAAGNPRDDLTFLFERDRAGLVTGLLVRGRSQYPAARIR
jgi:CubicO group peptidase (beta-lactamase class C family)